MRKLINTRRSLTFRIVGDTLYVANFGRRFDHPGVVSVCRENLSAKTNSGPGSSLDGVPDRDLVAAIRERRLEVYRTDIDQLREDANHERETSSDYAGRSLWELLQNADDALAPAGTSSADLIGAKGLGFKSVLEIADRPSIHSGPFDFGFDAAVSRLVLREIDPNAPDITFRLPHVVSRDSVTKSLMSEGYATVVRLPFRSMAVKAAVVDRLNALAPHFLLLCRNLDSVLIEETDSFLITMSVSRPRDLKLRNAPAKLTVTRNGERMESEWRLWSSTAPARHEDGKALSTAIAIPIVGGIEVPADNEIPVHVFFPTTESIAARILVHGSFALTANRNNIRNADHDDEVREALRQLVQQVVDDIPATSVVHVFGDIVRAAQTRRARRPDRLIQQAIASAVSDTAFVKLIGGGRSRPREVRTWDHDLADIASRSLGAKLRLPTREMAPVFAELRTIFGAEPLRPSDYALIIAELKVDTLPKALRAIQTAYAACLSSAQAAQLVSILATAAIWPTESGRFRALTERPSLLRRRPAEWPDWLTADTLHTAAQALLESYDTAATARWGSLLSGRLLRTNNEFLCQALAPEIGSWSEEKWDTAGYDALCLIEKWATIAEFSDIPPLVRMPDDNSVRLAIASVARIPTRNGWVASRAAYAGREINGLHELAAYFKAVPGRAVANAPTKATALFGAKRWKALLRYLGVSWEPKILFIGRDGTLANQSSFNAFSGATYNGLLHINEEWYIEHFPKCLDQLTAAQIATCVNALVTATSNLHGRWRKRSSADRAHAPEPFASFADFQLKQERYLPQRPVAGMRAGKFAPHELFWPGKGIAGITPILDVGTVNSIRLHGLKLIFVRRLHVRDTLPQEWRTWSEWSRALLERIEVGQQVPTKSVRAFYDAMLRISDQAKGKPPLTRVAATLPNRDGDVVVAASSDVLWIDNGRFENQEVLDGLGQIGKAILPIRLDRGKGAPEVLGVRPASEVLTVEPYYQTASENRSLEIARRLNARRGALAAICRTKNLDLKTLPRFLAVNDLRLRISLDSEPLADRSAASFKEGGRWLINLQSEKWDAVAAATAEQFGLHGPDLKYRFARILHARRDEVGAILSDDGIPRYSIREALNDLEGQEDTDDPTSLGNEAGGIEPPSDAGQDVLEDGDEELNETDDDEGDTGGTPNDPGMNSFYGDRLKGDGERRGGPTRLQPRKLFGGGGGDGHKRRRRKMSEAAEAAASRGFRAESWLMQQVVNSIGSDWVCSVNVRDDDLRETDLLLTRQGEEYHIEIKSLASERIYWSELEREKAELNPGRYFMALLVEDGYDGYSVRWLWDPLTDLANLPRRIEWLWRSSEEGPSVSDGWRLESGVRWPKRAADRFIHVVQVTQDHLDTFNVDSDGLLRLRTRIEGSATKQT